MRDTVDVDAILSVHSENEEKIEVRRTKSDTEKFTVPIMTNKKALKQGTELILPKPVETENRRPPKLMTWLAAATREMKQELHLQYLLLPWLRETSTARKMESSFERG